MPDGTFDPQVLRTALFDRRFTALARVGVDLAGITTWDPNLDRRTRLLVPIDVQAFVVAGGGEATVQVAGSGPDDPAPFADALVRPAGVHLHWAMPDALLRGRDRPTPPGSTPLGPEFPLLPDRWVVIRALFPVGVSVALIRGWVIDAKSRSVTPLPEYSGTPAEGDAEQRMMRLDAGFGGSLLWTASYTASEGRFGFHDPLDDLPAAGSTSAPQGLDAAGAVYTVAGWWTDLGDDPLAGSLGPRKLDERLAELGWFVVHDADDQVHETEDPRIARIRRGLGLRSPTEPMVRATTGAREINKLEGVDLQVAVPVPVAETVLVGPSRPRYATLLHGAILGVPLGPVPAGVDDRPAPDTMEVAVGTDIDDLVAAYGASALGVGPEHRASAERLTAAFTSDLLDRLGSSDGLADLAEREHADGFSSMPGTPVPGARPDRLRGEDSMAMGPTTVGRKGRSRAAAAAFARKQARLRWKEELDLKEPSSSTTSPSRSITELEGGTTPPAEVREVTRPAPRWFRPEPPMVAIRGAHPNHRHHGDGLFDDSGRLRCRYPNECVPAWEGVVAGDVVVPSIVSRAVPDEVLRVVREAVLVNGYAYRWLAAAGAASTGVNVGALQTRLAAEMVRLYGVEGRYDGLTHTSITQPKAAASPWAAISTTKSLAERQLTSEIARFSVMRGTPPSPVAITTWRQPWIPLWLEWEVTLDGDVTSEGWLLQGLDLERSESAGPFPFMLTYQGRSPISQGVSNALQRSMTRWLSAEVQRDASGASIVNPTDQTNLGRLADLIAPLDLVSASLDGIREQLLGIAYVGNAVEGELAFDGVTKPLAADVPIPLFGGIMRVERLRLVDAFGRVLTVPATTVKTTSTLEVPDVPNAMWLRPRFQFLARWLWRLVDPALPTAADPTTARDAFVDQVDPTLAVNPVVGFLLPDHIDEALEVFGVDGTPIGQLGHDAVSGAVMWETAPGRPVPPDAGPLAGLDAHARIAGEFAAGVVQADVAARTAGSVDSTALAALLRAIDTTLWTVDSFASVGSPTVAGLVGRPVAIVRATLRLEVPDDLAEVSVENVDPEARRAAFAALAEQRFPLQLGTLERSDDALLGFFVDDDYLHLHLVDKVVAAQARESGRHRGHLGLLGQVTEPAIDPLEHPYIEAEDVIWVRPGQTVRLTMLMLPAGKVHLTSGILPRKALALGDDWVTPGLARVMPSVRVGPVLVDPSEIRLPLVHLLGEKQTFTRRTGPLTWRDDPIVAATQTAYLPRMPHEVQEGWIRVTPEEAEEEP